MIINLYNNDCIVWTLEAPEQENMRDIISQVQGLPLGHACIIVS